MPQRNPRQGIGLVHGTAETLARARATFPQCEAIAKASGERCRIQAKKGLRFCLWHCGPMHRPKSNHPAAPDVRMVRAAYRAGSVPAALEEIPAWRSARSVKPRVPYVLGPAMARVLALYSQRLNMSRAWQSALADLSDAVKAWRDTPGGGENGKKARNCE